jgi:acetyl-CoA C-acetyltransferase
MGMPATVLSDVPIDSVCERDGDPRILILIKGPASSAIFRQGFQNASQPAMARETRPIRVERIEINEAFAAIAVVVARELGLPDEIVNVEGGAVAHGHPIGAIGAVLTTRLIHSMRRDGLTRGVVTLCIGGGQGIALAIEAMR